MSTGCTAESKGEEYNPCSFNKVMQGLDDLNKLLDDVKQRLDKSSMSSLLLNAELVCMFDPLKKEQLDVVKFECNECIERVEERLRRGREELATCTTSQ